MRSRTPTDADLLHIRQARVSSTLAPFEPGQPFKRLGSFFKKTAGRASSQLTSAPYE